MLKKQTAKYIILHRYSNAVELSTSLCSYHLSNDIALFQISHNFSQTTKSVALSARLHCCTVLHEVTRATTLARLLYASPAWWGFASVSDRSRVERFLQRTIRIGYLPPALLDAAVLVTEAKTTAGFGRPAASSRSSTTIPFSYNPTPRLASPSTWLCTSWQGRL